MGEKKRNVIAVAVIIALVAAAFAGVRLLGASSAASERVAVVHDGDGGTLELPLDTDATRTVTTSLGSNTIVVEGGQVRVSEADCPNHDCIDQGAIDEVGEQIVCLPHKLWVEIVEAGSGASGAPNAGGGFDVETR